MNKTICDRKWGLLVLFFALAQIVMASTDEDKVSKFRDACRDSKWDKARRIAERLKSGNATAGDGTPAIYIAVSRCRPDLCEILLEKGANVNACWKKDTMLTLAITGCSKDSVALLIARGADVNKSAPGGNTPLQVALEKKTDWDMVPLLLESGAGPKKEDLKHLERFILGGHLIGAECLLAKAVDWDPAQYKDIGGQTILHYLAKAPLKRKEDITKAASMWDKLVSERADMQKRDNYGHSPISLITNPELMRRVREKHPKAFSNYSALWLPMDFLKYWEKDLPNKGDMGMGGWGRSCVVDDTRVHLIEHDVLHTLDITYYACNPVLKLDDQTTIAIPTRKQVPSLQRVIQDNTSLAVHLTTVSSYTGRSEVCSRCFGKGKEGQMVQDICGSCRGSGSQFAGLCSLCRGKGTYWSHKEVVCSWCGGDGRVSVPNKISFQIRIIKEPSQHSEGHP